MAEPSSATGAVEVLSVTDGDTIRVLFEGRSEPVRYIGIDTPETSGPQHEYAALRHCTRAHAREASELNRRLVGRRVRLRFEGRRRDRYGRLLAYVYSEPDGTLVNAELIRRGFAEANDFGDSHGHEELFDQLTAAARRARTGLWGRC